MVDFHISSTSSSTMLARVQGKQSRIVKFQLQRYYNVNDHATTFDKGGPCHIVHFGF